MMRTCEGRTSEEGTEEYYTRAKAAYHTLAQRAQQNQGYAEGTIARPWRTTTELQEELQENIAHLTTLITLPRGLQKRLIEELALKPCFQSSLTRLAGWMSPFYS